VSWAEEGAPLRWHGGLSRRVRGRVLDQLALVQLHMLGCSAEDMAAEYRSGGGGGGAGGPASRFFGLLAEERRECVSSGGVAGVREQDGDEQMRLLPRVLHPELEHTPAAAAHGDLSARHIIVDARYNITG
jgi:hypothetical protein